MKYRLVVPIILLLLASLSVYGAETLQSTDWFDPGENHSVDGMTYKVLFGSGEPKYVQVKIDSDRVLVKLGECDWYEPYKFCYVETRFNPEDGEGSVNYETDKEYHQVSVSVYKEEVVLSELTTLREITPTELIPGEEMIIKVTITNDNPQTLFGMKYTEYIPDELLIVNFDGAIQYGNKMQWSGSLGQNEKKIITYTLRAQDGFQGSINATLAYEGLQDNFTTGIIIHSLESLFNVSFEWEEKTVTQFIEDELTFSIQNTFDGSSTSNSIKTETSLIVPHTLKVVSSTLQTETQQKYSKTQTLQEDEKAEHFVKFKPDTIGPHPLTITVKAIKNKGETSYTKTVYAIVPFDEARIIHQLSSLGFGAGDAGWLNVSVWNKNEKDPFTEVVVEHIGENIVLQNDEPYDVFQIGASERIHAGLVGFIIPEDYDPKKDIAITTNVTYRINGNQWSTHKRAILIRGTDTETDTEEGEGEPVVVENKVIKKEKLNTSTKTTLETEEGGAVLAEPQETQSVTEVATEAAEIITEAISGELDEAGEVILRYVIFVAVLGVVALFVFLIVLRHKKKDDETINLMEETETTSLADPKVKEKEDDLVNTLKKDKELKPPKKKD